MKKKIGIGIIILISGIILFFALHKSTIPKTNYITSIEFGDNIKMEGEGAVIKNNTVTISGGGIYTLSGSSNNSQIVVNANGQDVTLILNNLTLTSLTTAPIYVKKAATFTITLLENTENYLEDASSYQNTDQDEIKGLIHSKADLIINGEGKLSLKANYNNGIVGKDSVVIQNSNLEIEAIGNGIKAKDSLKIENADIKVTSKGNGIKTYNETDKNSGTMELVNSTIEIDAVEDGIEAITSLLIKDGSYMITSGGGSVNSSTNKNWGTWGTIDDSENSAKGIKVDGSLSIESGTFTIDSSDDSIHSNDTINIQNGTFTISSGDDGIHADDTLTIQDGTIDIEKSYEGIEATNLYLKGGTVHITSSDDGINAAGGNDGSSFNRPVQGNFTSDNSKIEITDGYYVIHASGDGIDSNGDIIMNDGTLIIEGPTDSGNGAIDYNGSYNINGGTLIAVGSSGMDEAPSNTSNQNSMKLSFSEQENTTIQITNSENQVLLTFSPSKRYSSLVYSSSNLQKNQTYTISFVESSEKTIDGIVSVNGEAKSGTVLTTLTLTDTVTTYGSSGMKGGPNKGMHGNEMPNRPPDRR